VNSKISEEEMGTLTKAADLPASIHRNSKAVTEALNKRMKEANQLSLKMRIAKHSHIVPITVFTYLENNCMEDSES